MQNNLGRLGGQLGVGLCLLGFLVIFLGWNGAGSNNYVPAQFPYLISGRHRRARRRRDRRGDDRRAEPARRPRPRSRRCSNGSSRRSSGRARQRVPAAGAVGGLGGYVVAGTTSYHQLDCELPEAREEARVVPLEDIRTSGLEPCRVCRPPQFGRLVNGAQPTPPLVNG